MKTTLLLLLASLPALLSCNLSNGYGKKLKINDKSEVYYKGEGITEAEAKKLGDYLLRIGYFDNSIRKTVQLMKDKKDDAYIIKFVVDEEALKKKRETAVMTFWYWQDMLSTSVLDGRKTKIILANTKLEDIEKMDELTRINVGKEHYLYLKGAGIPEAEGRRIADSLESASLKFFDYTAGAALLTRDKGTFTLRFMASNARQADRSTDYNIVLENLRYIISKYVLDGRSLNLVMIDGEFNEIRNINEPTEDRKLLIDQLIQSK